MSLDHDFRQAIKNTLNNFENIEYEISFQDAKAIEHIRQLLKADMELAEIRDCINNYVARLNGKLLSFIPYFINDLKKQLKHVLKTPEFSSYNCLFEDYKAFKAKMIYGNNHFQGGDSSNFISRDEYNKELKELVDLGKELRSKIQYYKEENALLKQELVDADNVNRSIRQEILELQMRMKSSDQAPINFESIINQKDREIAELKSEIFQLKLDNAKLRQNQQLPKNDSSANESHIPPSQPYKPGIYLSG